MTGAGVDYLVDELGVAVVGVVVVAVGTQYFAAADVVVVFVDVTALPVLAGVAVKDTAEQGG